MGEFQAPTSWNGRPPLGPNLDAVAATVVRVVELISVVDVSGGRVDGFPVVGRGTVAVDPTEVDETLEGGCNIVDGAVGSDTPPARS
jgi:hypothetical protein